MSVEPRDVTASCLIGCDVFNGACACIIDRFTASHARVDDDENVGGSQTRTHTHTHTHIHII